MRLVGQIYGDPTYKNEKGVNWKRAFADRPEWRDALGAKGGGIQRAYNLLNAVKEQQTNGNGHTSAQDAAMAERKELVRQIIKGYTKHGHIDWGRAQAEHPEWKEKLKDVTSGALTAMGRRIIKVEPEFAQYGHTPKRAKRVAQAEPEKERGGVAALASDDINITFSKAFLPEVLHTIAFSMSGRKGHRG